MSETGENYSFEESKITLQNAIKILENGGTIEGKSITGTQIKNAMINVLKAIKENKKESEKDV